MHHPGPPVGQGEQRQRVPAAEQAVGTIDGSFVRNLAMASLRLGVCRLRAERPDVGGGAQAIADAARLAAHNRSARLVGQLREAGRELEPWRDAPEVQDVREQLAAYGLV